MNEEQLQQLSGEGFNRIPVVREVLDDTLVEQQKTIGFLLYGGVLL